MTNQTVQLANSVFRSREQAPARPTHLGSGWIDVRVIGGRNNRARPYGAELLADPRPPPLIGGACPHVPGHRHPRPQRRRPHRPHAAGVPVVASPRPTSASTSPSTAAATTPPTSCAARPPTTTGSSLHEFPKLGKGGVLMETFRRCDADLVGFVDADCATPPAELAPAHRRAAQTPTASSPAAATPPRSRRQPASRARSRHVERASRGACAGCSTCPTPTPSAAPRCAPAGRRAGRPAAVVARLPVRRRPAGRRPPARLRRRRGADGVDRPGRIQAARAGGTPADAERRRCGSGSTTESLPVERPPRRPTRRAAIVAGRARHARDRAA